MACNRFVRGLLAGLFCMASLHVAQAQSVPPRSGTQPSADSAGSTASAIDGTTANDSLGEIVVTAEKRSTNLQNTPLSVTAINGDALRAAQVRGLEDIKGLVPAMQMGDNDGQAQITIRGIGISAVSPGAESAAALNSNDVYVSRPTAQLTGLYDVSSIEVLRGPQGTLYGRNAAAGSVNVTTTRPTDVWSGYAKASYGNFNAVNVEAAIGGPVLGDKVLFRLAGLVDKHDGYGKNLVTGNDVDDKNAQAIRGTLVFQANEELKATLIGEYYSERDNAGGNHYFGPAGLVNLPGTTGVPPVFIQQGGYAPSDEQDVASGRDPKFSIWTTALTGIVDWSHGPWGVKSITGHRGQNQQGFAPLDAGSTDNSIFIYGEKAHQISEELQGHYDDSRLHATTGLYFFHEVDSVTPGVATFRESLLATTFGIPYAPPDYFVDFVENGGTIRTRAGAAFGQASYEILSGLSLTAGLRYSVERKSAEVRSSFSLTAPYDFAAPPPPPAPVLEGPATFYSTTPKAGIEYQFTPTELAYFYYLKGFKAGGFDTSVVAPAYYPETISDYEAGLKSTFLDNRLRVNLSGFYYDYTNLQVTQVIGITAVTQNAATAKIYGGEAEITAKLIPSLQLDLAASYLHGRYDQYVGPSAVQSNLPSVDFSGRTLTNAPTVSGHAAATYTHEVTRGSLSARGELEFSSRVYFTPDNVDLLSQGSYAKGNIFLTYTSDEKWHATAFLRNLSDKTTRTSGNVNTPVLGSPARGSVAPPRTFGVEVGYSV